MSKTAKREYVQSKSREYARCLNRREKSMLIEEVARTCAYSRKYAARRLLAPLPSAPRKVKRARASFYTNEDVEWLKRIWRESDFLCGKLLVGAIAPLLESFAREGIDVPAGTRERLLRISPATIDRKLRGSKVEHPRKRCSSALRELREEIPVRALRASQCPEPGHLGLDTVALGGGSTFGEFFWILTLTDVYSGYTRICPVWNKSSEGVASALRRILPVLPFKPLELHSDNGSEFINSTVFHAVKELFPHCRVNRSRPCHKNDNAHAEQKNGAFVRGLFGEIRLDARSREAALERACDLASLRHNHFTPTRKAVSKIRDPLTGRTSSRYSRAKTPAARLESFSELPDKYREKLLAEASGRHFLQLNRELHEQLSRVVRPVVSSCDGLASGSGVRPSESASPPPSGEPRSRTPLPRVNLPTLGSLLDESSH